MSSPVFTLRELATEIRQRSDDDLSAFAIILENMAKTEFSHLGNEVYAEIERRSSHYFAEQIEQMRAESGMVVRNKHFDMEAAFNKVCADYTDTKGVTHAFPDRDAIEKLVAFITFTYFLEMKRMNPVDLTLIEDGYMEDFNKPGFDTNKEYVEYVAQIVERYDAMLRKQFMDCQNNLN